MRMAIDSPREAQDNERRQRYASSVARRLRATSDCRFSLLPAPELARIAGKWYDAALAVMNQCDPYSIDRLVHEYGCLAAEEGLTLADLLQLLRLCRQVAIEEDGWREEVFDNMDVLIDEALSRLRHKVAWQIPEGLNYLTGKSCADSEGEQSGQVEHLKLAKAAEPRGERRGHFRNQLRLPIRICGLLSSGPVEEITSTTNISKGGVYFLSRNSYFKGMRLQVVYPYWGTPDAVNRTYPVAVTRIDERKEGRGIALKFLVNLDSPSTAPATIFHQG